MDSHWFTSLITQSSERVSVLIDTNYVCLFEHLNISANPGCTQCSYLCTQNVLKLNAPPEFLSLTDLAGNPPPVPCIF